VGHALTSSRECAAVGAIVVTSASMVSTAYLQRALPVYDLVVPPETTSVNRVTHAFHVFRLKSAGWMGAPAKPRQRVS